MVRGRFVPLLYISSHSLSCSSLGQPWYGETCLPPPKARRKLTGMYSTALSAGAWFGVPVRDLRDSDVVGERTTYNMAPWCIDSPWAGGGLTIDSL